MKIILSSETLIFITRIRSTIGIVICVLFCIACSTEPIAIDDTTPTNTPLSSSILPTPVSTAGAIEESSLTSPLSEPPNERPTPQVIESQATALVPNELTIEEVSSFMPEESQAGLITGRLLDSSTELPAPYIWVYLARAFGPEDNPQVILNISNAQLSISNEKGIFYFQNVPPGRYGIVLWSPISSILVDEPNSEYSLLLSVEAGDVINLEDLISPIPY